MQDDVKMKLENRTLAEIKMGDEATLKRLITTDDLYVFAASSGNFNPMHLPSPGVPHSDPVAPGMFVASLISAVLGTTLPGAGCLYRHQTLQFHARAYAGDELETNVRVIEKHADGRLRLATTVRRASDGELILSGEADVQAPTAKLIAEVEDIPGLIVQRHRHFEKLLARAQSCEPLRTAVVMPEDENSLGGAMLAARDDLIIPILIGNPAKMKIAAQAADVDLAGYEIVEASSAREASQIACKLVRAGRVDAVMKGHLHTDDLLHPMLDKDEGLRIGRRFTHIFVMDVPGLPQPLLVTDAAINIMPDLMTKVDIVQNAIDLALSIGDGTPPRVGVLSAVETVNPAIPSSIDAALLSKMAERGQIKGGFVEGPLAMDNAVDPAAARTKGLRGEVAGHAQILVVPDIDAGNMLAKQLTFISHAEGAGLVLGARVPIILNSRSDSAMSRLASCAVAVLHHQRMKEKLA
jgi:phosphate butyryltransferase